MVRPSPFSAQKTFERHNSRRKSNISFCSQSLLQQMSTTAQAGSRRGSGFGIPTFPAPRPPPLMTTKSNSLSLPDSPTVAGYQRGRSNSLRVVDDILLRRSNSLRQGLPNVGNSRRKSSLEDIGLSHFSSNHSNPIKIALNGSIGLEVTPPEEVGAPVMSSNTSLFINPPPSLSASTLGIATIGSGVPSNAHASNSHLTMSQPLSLGINVPYQQEQHQMNTQVNIPSTPTGPNSSSDPQHLQGTIVWYNLMWGRRLSSVVRNKWLWPGPYK